MNRYPNRKNPELWDYRAPRTAREYLDNNVIRRRRRERKLDLRMQQLVAGSLLLFGSSVTVAFFAMLRVVQM